jgi:TPR repeat protein
MREDRVGDGVIRTLAGVLTSLGLAVVLATALCSGAAQAQSRIALVVGNSAYAHASALPTTLNDANDIAQTLEGLGFVTKKLVDASYEDFRRAVRAFNDLAPNAEVALIYFAGHGIAMNGENWIIPVDADLRTEFDVTTEAIGLNTLIQSAGSAGTLGIVILDACRDNPFVGAMARQTRSINRGLARVEPAQNVLVAYASKVGTTAEDGTGRNSPYTAALLKYLGAPGVDINLMLRKVRDDVRLHTNQKQQPFVYGSLPKRPIYLKEASVVIDAAQGSKPEVSKSEVSKPVVELDETIWPAIRDSTDRQLFSDFLNRFPLSPHAEEARAKLKSLQPRNIPSRETNPDVPTTTAADACDRLTASPLDTERANKVAGVELSKIEIGAAESACDEAMRRSPQVARFPFQAARVAMARGDPAAALQLYEKASELGSALAMYSLGLIYLEGKIVPQDYSQGRSWYEKAVALNSTFAMADLAALYENGRGGPPDIAKAFELYRRAATAGDRTSMTKLGNFYEAGNGVRQDYSEATRWYKQSAARGDEAAMRQLGKLYEDGRGVRRNAEEARRWYDRAARQRSNIPNPSPRQ